MHVWPEQLCDVNTGKNRPALTHMSLKNLNKSGRKGLIRIRMIGVDLPHWVVINHLRVFF